MYIDLHRSLAMDGKASANIFGIKHCLNQYWIYRRQIATVN